VASALTVTALALGAGPVQASSATPVGHIPCDIANAYHITGTSLSGQGVTIAVIGIQDPATITTDVAAFSSYFGLPNSFATYKEGSDFTGPGGNVTAASGYWAREDTIDVEWAHALAPRATVALVESASANSPDLLPTIDYAVNTLHADVVSMSFAVPAASLPAGFAPNNDSHFPALGNTGRPVAYVAAAGDNFFGANWPALSNHVIAVGGTSLKDSSNSAFGGYDVLPAHTSCSAAVLPGATQANETVWGTGGPVVSTTGGTGGGQVSDTIEPKPAWQTVGPSGSGLGRITPDVAADADAASGVALYFQGAWLGSLTGGTSLAAPLWAGVIALIDERATSNGKARFNVTAASNPLYSAPANNFNDVITGNSTPTDQNDPCMTAANSCVAGNGYDMVTGRGSPNVARLADTIGGPAVTPATPNHYFFSRYDNTRAGVSGDNIHIVHAGYAVVSIPGFPAQTLTGDGYVYFPPGTVGGPVQVATALPAVVTQRVQFNASFNEVPAMPDTAATSSLRFTWYDHASSVGFLSDDILVFSPTNVLSPGNLTVSIPGCNAPTASQLTGFEINYSCSFGTGFGGPVTIESTVPVLASQRVVYYGSFNEVNAMPSSSASQDLVFTWYDHASSFGFLNDNIHVMSPNPASGLNPANIHVTIPGCSPTATQFSASEIIYACPFGSGFGGPVTVHSDTIAVLASQRVQYFESFNEVAAMNPASAATNLVMTWYDHASSLGFQGDNVHVINPNGSLAAPVSVVVTIPGCTTPSVTAASASELIFSCPFGSGFGGPVLIHSTVPVLASQRVQFYQSFNEAAASV
jgi:subtilase family serine protease